MISKKDGVNKFIAECKLKLNNVGHENTFAKLILADRKHYIGISSDPNKEPVIKGMEAIKSDRLEFIHAAFRQMVDDIMNDINPIPKLKHALQQLDRSYRGKLKAHEQNEMIYISRF